MAHTLRKPKLSHRTFKKTRFNWARFLGYAYCSICACALAFIPPLERMDQQMVGIDQNNTTIELSVGQILQVKLPDNVRTGFEWRLHELDETILDLTENDNKKPGEDNPDFAEDPSHNLWTFKAVQTGSGTVRLLYYQPWEDKELAEKSFSIKTVVKL